MEGSSPNMATHSLGLFPLRTSGDSSANRHLPLLHHGLLGVAKEMTVVAGLGRETGSSRRAGACTREGPDARLGGLKALGGGGALSWMVTAAFLPAPSPPSRPV